MLKTLTMLALALSLAAPAFAAEMNKGGKSYQKRTNINQPASSQAPQNPEDVAKIAPAAGDQMPSETASSRPSQGKTLREELRLPRKH